MATSRETVIKTRHLLRRLVLLFVAAALIAVAGTALYGWYSGNRIMTSVLPSLTPMNPVTALCFLLTGLCCALRAQYRTLSRVTKTVCILTSILLLSVGGLMLAYYTGLFDAHIDRWLFTTKLGINRMAPSTAVCFTLSGIAFLLSVSRPNTKWLIRGTSLSVIFIATYTLISYAYGVEPVYGVAILNPMALHTAILFILLSIAVITTITKQFVIYVSAPLIAMYAVSIGLFISLSAYSFRTFINAGSTNNAVRQRYVEKTQIDDLRVSLVDAETGQRGYILTGNKAYLEPYVGALGKINKAEAEVESLPNNIMTVDEKQQVRTLTAEKLAELRQTIAVRDTSGEAAATALVKTGHGKALMDHIRSYLNHADDRNNAILATNMNQSKVQNSKALVFLSISTATILGLLLASLYFLQENLKRQKQTTAKIQVANDNTIEENHHLEAEVNERIHELENVKDSLEAEVTKRTTELKTELERTKQLNSFMIARELRIKNLKDELIELKAMAIKPKR